MNITKDYLKDNGIISMNFEICNQNYMCSLSKVSDNTLVFELSDELNIKRQDCLKWNILCQGNDNIPVSYKALIKVLDSGNDYIFGIYLSGDEYITSFLEKIAQTVYRDNKLGRRKEERIKIGKEKYKLFGLSSPEQTLISYEKKIIKPCVILDVSVHGICIITPLEKKTDLLPENFNIHMTFIHPDQTILLKAHKVHSKIKEINSNCFITLSCQLLEPISFNWKEKIYSILEKYTS